MVDSSFAFLYLHAKLCCDTFGVLKIGERIMSNICLHLCGLLSHKQKHDALLITGQRQNHCPRTARYYTSVLPRAVQHPNSLKIVVNLRCAI